MKVPRKAEAKLTVERSRFHALVFPAADLDAVKEEIAWRRRKHHKARHHCWACRIMGADGKVLEQARDDGEVGRPGYTMLDLLRARDLEGAIVVSRYFGGVKLGPGGVKRAFRDAAAKALAKLLPL